MPKSSSTYIPGMCNIGPVERRARRIQGITALVVSIIALVLLVMIGAPLGWRLFLIVPFSGAATGFLQDAFHFCAGFGMRGVYNVLNSVGVTDSVDQADYRRKDRQKAQLILGLSVLIGVVLTALSLLI